MLLLACYHVHSDNAVSHFSYFHLLFRVHNCHLWQNAVYFEYPNGSLVTVKELSVDRSQWSSFWLCSRREGTTGIVKEAAEE